MIEKLGAENAFSKKVVESQMGLGEAHAGLRARQYADRMMASKHFLNL